MPPDGGMIDWDTQQLVHEAYRPVCSLGPMDFMAYGFRRQYPISVPVLNDELVVIGEINIMNDRLKDIVRSKYNEIALQSKEQNQSSCCGSTGCCDNMEYTIMSDDYSSVEGYNEAADLGLGCGIPTAYAGISENDTVIDLGSGAGNDAFVARSIVGSKGKVIGIDFAGAMLTKARNNVASLGFDNVEDANLSSGFCYSFDCF